MAHELGLGARDPPAPPSLIVLQLRLWTVPRLTADGDSSDAISAERTSSSIVVAMAAEHLDLPPTALESCAHHSRLDNEVVHTVHSLDDEPERATSPARHLPPFHGNPHARRRRRHPTHPRDLGHADASTTSIYTRVSIKHLKLVHNATHPAAKLPEATAPTLAKTTADDELPTKDDLFSSLDAEAAEDSA